MAKQFKVLVYSLKFKSQIRPTYPSFHFQGRKKVADKLCAAFISIYVVASKYSRKRFISENYTIVQSVKLHFIRNILLVQLYTSSSYGKSTRNIPGSHFVKAS